MNKLWQYYKETKILSFTKVSKHIYVCTYVDIFYKNVYNIYVHSTYKLNLRILPSYSHTDILNWKLNLHEWAVNRRGLESMELVQFWLDLSICHYSNRALWWIMNKHLRWIFSVKIFEPTKLPRISNHRSNFSCFHTFRWIW